MIPFPKPTKEDRPKKKRKKSPRTLLKERVIRAFSQFVRLNESDESGTGACITCGTLRYYKAAHAGHFVRCGKEATRFDERNVHFQCPECNTYREGERWKFGKWLQEHYYEGLPEELEAKALERKCWTIEELEGLLKYYREGVKKLLAGKTLED